MVIGKLRGRLKFRESGFDEIAALCKGGLYLQLSCLHSPSTPLTTTFKLLPSLILLKLLPIKLPSSSWLKNAKATFWTWQSPEYWTPLSHPSAPALLSRMHLLLRPCHRHSQAPSFVLLPLHAPRQCFPTFCPFQAISAPLADRTLHHLLALTLLREPPHFHLL